MQKCYICKLCIVNKAHTYLSMLPQSWVENANAWKDERQYVLRFQMDICIFIYFVASWKYRQPQFIRWGKNHRSLGEKKTESSKRFLNFHPWSEILAKRAKIWRGQKWRVFCGFPPISQPMDKNLKIVDEWSCFYLPKLHCATSYG